MIDGGRRIAVAAAIAQFILDVLNSVLRATVGWRQSETINPLAAWSPRSSPRDQDLVIATVIIEDLENGPKEATVVVDGLYLSTSGRSNRNN
jgi:hypothetical protein